MRMLIACCISYCLGTWVGYDNARYQDNPTSILPMRKSFDKKMVVVYDYLALAGYVLWIAWTAVTHPISFAVGAWDLLTRLLDDDGRDDCEGYKGVRGPTVSRWKWSRMGRTSGAWYEGGGHRWFVWDEDRKGR